MVQDSNYRYGREAASGEIRVNGSLISGSGLLRDERPKVGLGRSGQSNNLAPVPSFIRFGTPNKSNRYVGAGSYRLRESPKSHPK